MYWQVPDSLVESGFDTSGNEARSYREVGYREGLYPGLMERILSLFL
jgi:hypothetical protein